MSAKRERANNDEADKKFSLNETSNVFTSRSKDIFAGLEALEQKHEAYRKVQSPRDDCLEREGIIKYDPVVDDEGENNKRDVGKVGRDDYKQSTSYSRNKKWRAGSDYDNKSRNDKPLELVQEEHKKFHSSSSVGFRRPGRLAPRPKRIPDHKAHPENWTCYSLEDVADTDLSDRSNQRAALDFLMQRKDEREESERIAAGLPAEEEEKFESTITACSKGVITFSRGGSSSRSNKQKHDNINRKDEDEKMDDSCQTAQHTGSDNNTSSKPVTPAYLETDESLNSDDVSATSHSHNLQTKTETEIDDRNKRPKFDASSPEKAIEVDEDIITAPPTSIPAFKSRKNIRKQIRKVVTEDGDEID